jgi:uncharacterized iron-regulated protein
MTTSARVELEARLEHLSCLARVTKEIICWNAAEQGEEWLRRYLDGPLAVVERYVGGIHHPAFVALCQQLNNLENPEWVLKVLGLPSGFDPARWLNYADALQLNPLGCLYCLANVFALGALGNADAEAVSWVLLGHCLMILGNTSEATLGLEEYAGVRPADYRDPQTLGRRLEERLARRLEPNNVASYLNALAKALRCTDRIQEAAVVLEWYVRLQPTDYQDPHALRQRLEQLLDQRLAVNNAANYVRALGDTLHLANRNHDAVAILEEYVGLQSADYRDPRILRYLLAHKLEQRLTANNTSNYIVTLADTLQLTDRVTDAVVLLEAYAELQPADYLEPQTLGQRLAQRLEQRLTADNTANYVIMLAKCLLHTTRNHHAVAVLEGHVGLEPADYQTAHTLHERLEQRLDCRVTAINAAVYVQTLGDALRLTSRTRDAAALLEGYAGLQSADYLAPQTLRQRLQQQLEQRLTANNMANYVIILAAAICLIDRDRDAAVLLEAYAELQPADYLDLQNLRQRLQQRLDQRLEANSAANYVVVLASCLLSADRNHHAAGLLEGYAGLQPADYLDATSLRQRLEQFFDQRLAATNAVSFVQTLGDTLLSNSRTGDAVALLEGYAGLQPADYLDLQALGHRLEHRFKQGLRSNNAVNYVITLATALRFMHRERQAAALLEEYVGDFSWLEQAGSDLPANNLCPLGEQWLSFHGTRPEAWVASQRLVDFLRRTFGQQALSRHDRDRLVQVTRQLRSLLVQVAEVRAWTARDTQEAHRWHLSGVLWDAELGQMQLVHQFLLGQASYLTGNGARLPPVGTWPYPEDSAGSKEENSDLTHTGLHQTGAGGGMVPLHDQATGSPTPAAPARCANEDPSQELAARVAERLGQGLDEGRLAALLGKDVVLLRATVAPTGQLAWLAVCSDGQALSLVQPLRRGGQLTDGLRLAWSVARHEVRISLVYGAAGLKDTYPAAQTSVFRSVEAQRRRQAQERGDGLPAHDLIILAQAGLATLQRTLSEVKLPGVARRLAEAVGPLLQRSNQEGQVEDWWCEATAAEWDRTLAILESALCQRGKYQALNEATRQLLREVETVWDLSPLTEQLSGERDLLVQVDGVLHGVPVALLQAGNRPLWQQTRSVRNSMSVLLDELEAETEANVPGGANRLSSLVWFAPEDDAAVGGRELLRQLRALAAREELEWYGAAVEPEGTLEMLQSMACLGGQVLSVCGHGDERSGIRLGPGPKGVTWEGGRMELGGWEMVLAVSCSLGRLRGSRGRDVEGFCVRMALGHARAMVAARWPVDCVQGARVAACLVDKYIHLRKGQGSGPRLTAARVRARALQQLREKLLGDGDSYLNTVAAFDLWGLA